MNSNWNISWEETQDPKALNTNPNVYLRYTRDPMRTPFQWNDDFNAGNTQTHTLAENKNELPAVMQRRITIKSPLSLTVSARMPSRVIITFAQ